MGNLVMINIDHMTSETVITELSTCIDYLKHQGWNRDIGMRLISHLDHVPQLAIHGNRLELDGRTRTLQAILNEFIHDAPKSERLTPVLQAAENLVQRIMPGFIPDELNHSLLPLHPADWTFTTLGEPDGISDELLSKLQQIGFQIAAKCHSLGDWLVARERQHLIVFVDITWLNRHRHKLHALKAHHNIDQHAVLIALMNRYSQDTEAALLARQAGAQLLLETPLQLNHALYELAGLVWQPKQPYRVVIIHEQASLLATYAAAFHEACLECVTEIEPLAALAIVRQTRPDVCIIASQFTMCSGIDLAFVIRQNELFSCLPIIYLSAQDTTLEHIIMRGVGDSSINEHKVSDLVSMALHRARHFRRRSLLYHRLHEMDRELETMKTAIDAHAIVSIAAADGSILEINRKFCDVSGYTQKELIGQNHRMVRSGHHPQPFFKKLWSTIKSGRVWQGELQNRRKDGFHYWVKSTIVPVLDEHGQPVRFLSIRTDITEQKQLIARYKRTNRLLDMLRQATQDFLTTQDLNITSNQLLDGLLVLAESTYGFLGEVLEDEEKKPYLKAHAISNLAWNKATQTLYSKNKEQGMEFHNLNTLFGVVLRTQKAFATNQAQNDPQKGGLPSGHPPIGNFLGIPVYHNDCLVGMIGLANRPDGYDDAMIHFLQPMTMTYGALIDADRRQKIQKQTVNDLQRMREAGEQTRYDQYHTAITNWLQDIREPMNNIIGHAKLLALNPGLDIAAWEQIQAMIRHGEQLIINLNQHPIVDRHQQQQQLSKEQQQNHTTYQSIRILIVDADLSRRVILETRLKTLGYTVDLTTDSQTALAHWQKASYALIFIAHDIMIIDGIALARSIRATERGTQKRTPLIAIATTDNLDELATYQQAGMDGLLPTPVTLDVLLEVLEHWIPSHNHHSITINQSEFIESSHNGTLDVAYMHTAIGHLDLEQMRNLVDLFTTTTSHDLVTCNTMLAEHNSRGIALTMHKLKSSARMVGALRFTALAEQLEMAAKSDHYDQMPKLLQELEHALEDVETTIQRFTTIPDTLPTETDDSGLTEDMIPKSVLVVDDDPMTRLQVSLLLKFLGVADILTADSAKQALTELARQPERIHLVITDLSMPEMDGIEFLRRLAEQKFSGGLMICSGVDEQLLQTASELVRIKGLNLQGALTKPVTRQTLIQLFTTVATNKKQKIVKRANDTAITKDMLIDGLARHEFDVFFQPKVDANTLQTVGLEALARWQHQGQFMRPDLFIVAAERSGLIGQLSERLLSKALQGGTELLTAGFRLNLAVNLSANWLADVNLPEFIVKILEQTQFPAEQLILEITETGIMADMETSLDILTRLRLKGFKLSIDDFGTGYSSMEQLQRIPFSELKLDRSFVQGAQNNSAARTILASSVSMAKHLHLTTVAEGVETQEELDLIRGLGCDLIQGWLIAKAMPVQELISWLIKRER
jgi:PAS domain S-box-containing protein